MAKFKKRKPRSDGRYSINISFTEDEYALIEHVDSKSGNFSAYVKELIKKDMEGQPFSPEILMELLKDNFQKGFKMNTENKEEANQVNKKAINNILNKSFL